MLFLDLAPGVEAKLIAAAYAAEMSVSEYVKALLETRISSDAEKPVKPSVVIDDMDSRLNIAIRTLKENQIKNRELTVQAIVQKNNLMAEVDKEERIIADYERKASEALQFGNREQAKQFFQEKLRHERRLPVMKANLAAAILSVDLIKQTIRQEEEAIKITTAEAMAMQTNNKQAQITERTQSFLERIGEMGSAEAWTPELEQAFENWAEQTRSEKTKTSVQNEANESVTGHDAN